MPEIILCHYYLKLRGSLEVLSKSLIQLGKSGCRGTVPDPLNVNNPCAGFYFLPVGMILDHPVFVAPKVTKAYPIRVRFCRSVGVKCDALLLQFVCERGTDFSIVFCPMRNRRNFI